MSKRTKILSLATLLALLTLSLATPASAFDGRGGERVTIASGETVNDDLYVGATEFVLDGTVNGDVLAGGRMITINGTVNGNLIAAGSTVVVNGTVSGDVLASGSVLFFGDKARIGGDVVSAGYSLELSKGSTVGRDAIMAAGQILLASDVARNVKVGAGGLEIDGNVGGNVEAFVGEANQVQTAPPPNMFMGPSTIPVPVVKQGLTIDPAAKIAGSLKYQQNSDLSFPAGVVAGTVTRVAPPETQGKAPSVATPAEKTGKWALNLFRTLVTLILLGLFLLWVVPSFLKALSANLLAKPWPSLGLGAVAYAGFVFLILLILFVAIVGAVIFGLLTLGGLSGTFAWLGVLGLFALIVAFVLMTAFVAKIVFGMTLGKWILSKANSPLAEHKYWPMVIGVAITVFVIALFSFPLIPGFLGGLLNFLVILFGLGALWLWLVDVTKKRPAVTAAQ